MLSRATVGTGLQTDGDSTASLGANHRLSGGDADAARPQPSRRENWFGFGTFKPPGTPLAGIPRWLHDPIFIDRVLESRG